MFQKGQSGNPNGRPRGIHGGRAKALILLDSIAGKSKSQRLIGAAIPAGRKRSMAGVRISVWESAERCRCGWLLGRARPMNTGRGRCCVS